MASAEVVLSGIPALRLFENVYIFDKPFAHPERPLASRTYLITGLASLFVLGVWPKGAYGPVQGPFFGTDWGQVTVVVGPPSHLGISHPP